MRSFRLALTAFGILPVAFAVACSSSSNAGDDTNGGDSGSGTDSATHDGSPGDAGSLVTDDSTVTASENGGFTAQAPDGSTCQPIANSYTYVIATKTFSWSICSGDDAGIYAPVTGTRVLTASEASDYRAKLDAVKIDTTKVACGTDSPSESLQIVTGGTTTVLYDESENCLSNQTYADGVGAVIVAASDLAHE